MGRARDDPHHDKPRSEEKDVPIISLDYATMGSEATAEEEETKSTILCMTCSHTKALFTRGNAQGCNKFMDSRPVHHGY